VYLFTVSDLVRL